MCPKNDRDFVKNYAKVAYSSSGFGKEVRSGIVKIYACVGVLVMMLSFLE